MARLSESDLNTTRSSALIRILVADDFEPWRRKVCSMLKKQSELHVIGEAMDGLEAVQKAYELRPDLILLDLGLPRLNGIKAANRIRQVIPEIRIVFLTAVMDKEVLSAALSTGAEGYVLKIDAGAELLTAVAAVVDGHQFLSRGIK